MPSKAEYHREWYRKNRVKVIERRKVTRPARREKIRGFISAAKAGKSCIDCGESDPIVLDFDHVRGTKSGNLGEAVGEQWSFAKIRTEIAKCEIRCANCHRRKTHRERQRDVAQSGQSARFGSGKFAGSTPAVPTKVC